MSLANSFQAFDYASGDKLFIALTRSTQLETAALSEKLPAPRFKYLAVKPSFKAALNI
jgi:hypothetical protein